MNYDLQAQEICDKEFEELRREQRRGPDMLVNVMLTIGFFAALAAALWS